MIDYTWFPVVVLHFALVSIYYFPQQIGNIELTPAFIYGGILTVLMFGSIIVHELAHAFAAKLEHIQTTEIRLHIFGGYARMASDPPTALAELRIAIAGPVASFLLGVAFMVLLLLSQTIFSGAMRVPLQVLFMYLFTGNIALAMFNLIPGLPLDGGRVLRAYLWHRNKDILAATLTAKRLGVALAYMLASYGIYRMIWWRDPFTAIWMIVLAFLLKRSAEDDYRYRKLQSEFKQQSPTYAAAQSGTVGAIMKPPPICIAPNMLVSDFIAQILTKHRLTSFPVAMDGRLHGILSLEKLRALPEEKWSQTTVSTMMQPVDDSLFVTAQASLQHAAQKLNASAASHLAVIDGNGILVGYLSAADLERAR